MGKASWLRIFLTFLFLSLSMDSFVKGQNIVCPNKTQMEWADDEIGVLIHFDMPVFQPEYDWEKFGTNPNAKIFNPTELNTDQWIATAKKLGAKYAILVAKHCSGFSLWPTSAHEYSVKNSPWENGQGDIVKRFINSCKKYGVKPGIYASTWFNGYLYVKDGVVQPGSPVTQKEYNNIVVKQLTELWTNYGKLFEVWFDGGLLSIDKGGADVLSLLRKLQPDAIAFQGPYGYKNLIRWVGNEVGAAPYPCWATADSTTNSDGIVVVEGLNGRAEAPYWCPGESDFTLRWKKAFQGGWFWHKDQDKMMYTLDELMQRYVTSVGHNTNMLLGMVVDNRGLVPDADVKRITEFGNEIKREYGHPLANVNGKGDVCEIKLKTPTSVNRIVLQEDISKGERVLEYKVTGLSKGKWITLAKGSNIGHKHIDVFSPRKVTRLKLTVTKEKATPIIRNFSVFKALKTN
jgi:alpha-L-fucosidase